MTRGEAAAGALTADGIVARFVTPGVLSEAAITTVVGEMAASTGIDILVNNAGIARHRDTLEAGVRRSGSILCAFVHSSRVAPP